jgi:hypothetical protein
MSTNGRRRPRRPRIELVTPTPSPAEAEAIATAIERFVADTAPGSAVAASERLSAWQRAAIREGVGARGALGFPWGEPPGWGP